MDFGLHRQKGRAKKLAHRKSFDRLCQKMQYKTIFSEEILADGTSPVSDAEEHHLICVAKRLVEKVAVKHKIKKKSKFGLAEKK